MSEGEVKEVQGQAISVYGDEAVMVRCRDGTLIFRSD
jgi:translation initiation factor IF-1